MKQEEAIKIIEKFNVQKKENMDNHQHQAIGCLYALNDKYIAKHKFRLFSFWEMVSFIKNPDIFLSLVISNIDELHKYNKAKSKEDKVD